MAKVSLLPAPSGSTDGDDVSDDVDMMDIDNDMSPSSTSDSSLPPSPFSSDDDVDMDDGVAGAVL